jgi:hypothetical protein
MAKEIVIDNQKFDFNTGVRILKLKHKECPFEQISDFWDEIVPLTFKDIAQLVNLEQRRIGINHLGLERLIESVKPTLVDTKTIKKTTTWVDTNGKLENKHEDCGQRGGPENNEDDGHYLPSQPLVIEIKCARLAIDVRVGKHSSPKWLSR